MAEHHQQAAVVTSFKYRYPDFGECLVAIPNSQILGGMSHKSKMAYMNKLKKEGLKPGASDLFIAVPRGDYHGLWLEMKDRGKTYCSVTKSQRGHLELMATMGYRAEWAPGYDRAMEIITSYMSL